MKATYGGLIPLAPLLRVATSLAPVRRTSTYGDIHTIRPHILGLRNFHKCLSNISEARAAKSPDVCTPILSGNTRRFPRHA